MLLRFIFLLFMVCFMSTFALAQPKDSTIKITDTAKNNTKPPKQKEIKKLEDPLLALPAELIYKLKKMIPNELLVIDERFVRNEKRVDDDGQEYEVTVTVRMGFSQDMITGIVKEVPLYQSTGRETNLLYVKIPVKFCCTTPIDDSLHTKQHCAKMSELNGFEDSSHCKAWVQKDDAQAEAENVAGFGKAGGSKTSGKKKGGDVSGKTSVGGDDEGYGKPIPKGKPSKKGKNGKPVIEEEETTDSTGKVIKPITNNLPNKKGNKTIAEKPSTDSSQANNPEAGFGKPSSKEKSKKKTTDKKPAPKDDGYGVPNYKEEPVVDSANTEQKVPVKTKAKPTKKEEPKKKETTDEEGFGKPLPKDKKKKADKGKETPKDTTNMENKEPIKSVDSTGVKQL